MFTNKINSQIEKRVSDANAMKSLSDASSTLDSYEIEIEIEDKQIISINCKILNKVCKVIIGSSYIQCGTFKNV